MPHRHRIGDLAWPRNDVETAVMERVDRIMNRHTVEGVVFSVVVAQRPFSPPFFDGVYTGERGRLRFQRVKAPDKGELESLVHTLSGGGLGVIWSASQGLLVRDRLTTATSPWSHGIRRDLRRCSVAR